VFYSFTNTFVAFIPLLQMRARKPFKSRMNTGTRNTAKVYQDNAKEVESY